MNEFDEADQLIDELQKACEQRDWKKLEELDVQLRDRISRFVQMAKTEEQKKQLAAWLKSIQAIYQMMQEDGERYRDEIALELKKLNRDKKAVNSYLDSAGY